MALLLALTCALHGVVRTVDIVVARRSSPQALVQRLFADLPADERVTLRGFNNDVSLLPLFYFPDPSRIVVVPDGAPQPAEFGPGYYLFTRDEWTRLEAKQPMSASAWDVHWTAELALRPSVIPVMFVEKSASRSMEERGGHQGVKRRLASSLAR